MQHWTDRGSAILTLCSVSGQGDSALLSLCQQSDDRTVYPKLARTDEYSSVKCDVVTVKTAVFWDDDVESGSLR